MPELCLLDETCSNAGCTACSLSLISHLLTIVETSWLKWASSPGIRDRIMTIVAAVCCLADTLCIGRMSKCVTWCCEVSEDGLSFPSCKDTCDHRVDATCRMVMVGFNGIVAGGCFSEPFGKPQSMCARTTRSCCCELTKATSRVLSISRLIHGGPTRDLSYFDLDKLQHE